MHYRSPRHDVTGWIYIDVYKRSVLRRQSRDTNRNIKRTQGWCTADTDSKV